WSACHCAPSWSPCVYPRAYPLSQGSLLCSSSSWNSFLRRATASWCARSRTLWAWWVVSLIVSPFSYGRQCRSAALVVWWAVGDRPGQVHAGQSSTSLAVPHLEPGGANVQAHAGGAGAGGGVEGEGAEGGPVGGAHSGDASHGGGGLDEFLQEVHCVPLSQSVTTR